MHAILYIGIAVIYVGTMGPLDKSVATMLLAALYALMGFVHCPTRLKNKKIARWVALLGLIIVFQNAEVGALAAGENRPSIIHTPAVATKPPRAD